MRSHILTALLFCLCFTLIGNDRLSAEAGKHRRAMIPGENTNPVTREYKPQRIAFTENRGQIIDVTGKPCPDILFTADAGGAKLYFTRRGVSYVFTLFEESQTDVSEATGGTIHEYYLLQKTAVPDVTFYRMDMMLLGSNPSVRIRPENELYGYDNYYYAHCPDGITHVKSYGRIVYENVYDNIDMIFTSSATKTKYEFIVHPGGDISNIRLWYDGATGIDEKDDDRISIFTPIGEISEQTPYSYQDGNRAVVSAFVVEGNEITFDVGEYDPSQPLVIDPWATYYGGNVRETGLGISSDGSGNVAVTGWTTSTNFPVQSGHQGSHAGDDDAFVIKLSSAGVRQWATYYGGSQRDRGNHITMDGNGSIIITGPTTSWDFPVHNAVQPTTGSVSANDAFIVKFNSGGIRQWATYFGGASSETSWGVVTDANANIIFTGGTFSTNFTVLNAHQPANAGGKDAYLVKLSSTGTILWSTYYGGSGNDVARRIDIDDNGNPVITGWTLSTNFPALNAFQGTHASPGIRDAFVVKFNSNGVPQWSTYYGGSSWDWGYGITADGNGDVIISGNTGSVNFPVQNAFQTTSGGGEDAFVVKFNANGVRQWATYYGGSSVEISWSIATDDNDNVLFTGVTLSSNFPVLNASQPYINGSEDAFVVKFNASGTRQWATFLGGSSGETGYGITTDGSGNVLVAGETWSTDFPVFNAWQSSSGGGSHDAIVVSLTPSGVIPVELISFTASVLSEVIHLNWRTASERNNHGFEVQRARDPEGPWRRINFVKGRGTSNHTREYQFVDRPEEDIANDRILYYRLKQIDFDGSFEYSPVVSVQLTGIPLSAALLTPYPNPAQDYLFIPFTVANELPITIRLHNMAGQELLSVLESTRFKSGSHSLMAKTLGLPSGTYIIEFISGLLRQTRRVTIVR